MPTRSRPLGRGVRLFALLALSLLFPAGSLWAQPDFGGEQRIGDLVVFPDHLNVNRFYYAPGPLRLAQREGIPAVRFLLTRYVGTSVRGDQGEVSYFARLTFGIEMDGPKGEELRDAASRLASRTGRQPELRPLPIRRLEARVIFTPIGEAVSPDTLDEGHFEAAEDSGRSSNDGFWHRRTYSLRLDRQSAEAVWKTLEDGQALVSFAYAFITEGLPGGAGSGDLRMSSAVTEEERAKFEAAVPRGDDPSSAEEGLVEQAVRADAFAVELDASRHADLIMVHDLNQLHVDPAYSVLEVRCYDFRNGLRPDLWMKRVELAAEAVNGRTARITVTFSASEPDLHAESVRFPYAVRLDRPLRYRVVEIARDGTRVATDWHEKDSWVGLIDATSGPDRIQVEADSARRTDANE
jgi:hypothetical protein